MAANSLVIMPTATRPMVRTRIPGTRPSPLLSRARSRIRPTRTRTRTRPRPRPKPATPLGEQLQDANAVSVLYGGGRDSGLGAELSTESARDLTALSQDQGLFSDSQVILPGGLSLNLPLSTLDLLGSLADGADPDHPDLILFGRTRSRTPGRPLPRLDLCGLQQRLARGSARARGRRRLGQHAGRCGCGRPDRRSGPRPDLRL